MTTEVRPQVVFALSLVAAVSAVISSITPGTQVNTLGVVTLVPTRTACTVQFITAVSALHLVVASLIQRNTPGAVATLELSVWVAGAVKFIAAIETVFDAVAMLLGKQTFSTVMTGEHEPGLGGVFGAGAVEFVAAIVTVCPAVTA